MRRWLACAIVVVAATGTAIAGPTRKVTITTDPAKAKVWLNDKESEPVCSETPCTFDAPLGETPMIIELPGYSPEITVLEVPRGNKTLAVPAIKLEASSGILDVQYDGPVEAKIKIDGKGAGLAPQQIPLDPGPHKVLVVANGNPIFDNSVEIELGQTVTITPTIPEAPPGPPPPDTPDPPPTGGEIHKVAPAKARLRYVTVQGLFDVGFRQFSYSNAVAPMAGPNNVGDDSEKGQLMAGPQIEIYPAELVGVPAIKGLALVARLEFGLNQQAVNDSDLGGSTTTFWQAIEVSVRDRFDVLDGQIGVEPSIGYTRDRYQFNGADTDIALVPDADYQAVKIGVRALFPLGMAEPYIDLQNRSVVDGGDMAKRFVQAGANGVHAAVGMNVTSGKISGRLEAALTRYSWSFSNNGAANPMYNADGATDTIEQITLSVGYTY